MYNTPWCQERKQFAVAVQEKATRNPSVLSKFLVAEKWMDLSLCCSQEKLFIWKALEGYNKFQDLGKWMVMTWNPPKNSRDICMMSLFVGRKYFRTNLAVNYLVSSIHYNYLQRSVTQEIKKISSPWVTNSLNKSSERNSPKESLFSLLLVISKQLQTGIWVLMQFMLGKSLSTGSRESRGIMNRFILFFSVLKRRKRA